MTLWFGTELMRTARKSLARLPLSAAGAARRFFDPCHYRAYFDGAPPFDGDGFDHFMAVGWRKGYDPSLLFSTRDYLLANPDVAASGVNPLDHFIRHGRREGRKPLPYQAARAYFDRTYYRAHFGSAAPFEDDGFGHFLAVGWRKGYDPSPLFDTRAYLAANPDVATAGVNPLLHFVQYGQKEGRAASPFYWPLARLTEPPPISVVVLAGDDGGALAKALAAIDQQTHRPIETLVVTDASLSGSAAAAENMPAIVGGPETRFVQAPNGLPAFTQWRFGWDEARGDLLWCLDPRSAEEFLSDPAFLGDLAVCFVDQSVMAAFDDGEISRNAPASVSAFMWFNEAGATPAGALHLSRFLFRKQPVAKAALSASDPSDLARSPFLRSVANGGRIARRNRERERDWRAEAKPYLGSAAALKRGGKPLHVLVAFRGFLVGGAEIFPVHLANGLVNRGLTVSMMPTDVADENTVLRRKLDPRIAVFQPGLPFQIGTDKFCAEHGIDLIHSHCSSADHFFFGGALPDPGVPYVVSLHGHYDVEGHAVSAQMRRRMAESVSHWVYTAKKNLNFLGGMTVDRRSVSQIPNGMYVDPDPFPLAREELGLSADDLVFTLVARAIPEKGWTEAIDAIARAQTWSTRRLVLLLCGAGDYADDLRRRHADNPNVIFLGFQDRIHGLYRLSDCALLPSRFSGESFPLCLIQSMQAGTPIIATRIGEIGSMLCDGRHQAGILLDVFGDTGDLVSSLTRAMLRMCDDEYRAQRAADAAEIAKQFGIEPCAERYASLYSALTGGKAAAMLNQNIGFATL